jgi:hypothetical protein
MKTESPQQPTFWLRLAQVGWVALAVATLVLTLASVPSYFASLHHILLTSDTPDFGGPLTTSVNGSDLTAMGLSIDFYARFSVGVVLASWLVYAVVATIIFLRKSNDRMALITAFTLILMPIAINTDNFAAWPASWSAPLVSMLQFLGEISIAIFFFTFPGGTLAPRWTRWALLVEIVYWVLDIFDSSAFTAGPFALLSFVLFLGLMMSLVVAQVWRYRTISTPRQRQQSKWVVYTIALVVTGAMLEIVVVFVILPGVSTPGALVFMLGGAIQSLLLALFPVSIAIAILRSQLWDIDVLINRTLVYGLLTGILAALYFGSVVLLDMLARDLTGRVNSTPVIVVSTLLIAALFQPLRRRIQSAIDRRFYRRKYNAAHTIAAFGITLRGSVDLNDLTNQLLATVDSTMQPAHVSLWLSAEERTRPDNSPHGA